MDDLSIERFIEADASELASESLEWQLADQKLDFKFPQRNLKRVLFVAPPDSNAKNFNYETCKLGRYPNFPPYGVGVLASRLRNEGVIVDVLNLNLVVLRACRSSETEDDFHFESVVLGALKEKLETFKPDFVGLTCMFSQTHGSAVSTCHLIRETMPDVAIGIGGVHVTNSSMDEKTRPIFFKDLSEIDFFFTYESDLSFIDFVKVVNQELPVSSLAQVIFNNTEGQLYFSNRKGPKTEDLNIIPAHDLITPSDLAEHGKIGSYHMFARPGSRFSTVLSNRGCRAHCTFCSVRNFNGMGVRGRDVQSVIDELLVLRHEHGIRHIMWLDDDFLKDHGRAMNLFNEMVRQNVDMTWDCTNGVIAWSCQEELIGAAAASGCVGLTIGMESGNPQILRNIRKPGTVEVFLRAASVFRKFEQINARVFLMIGFPHETFSMVRDTFNVAKEMNLDWSNITPLQPLPNTPIFTQMALEGMIGAVVFDEIRYKLGAHGKQRQSTERKVNVFATDFNEVFEQADMNAIPTKTEINRLWAYMNYHLNFARLLHEHRPAKHQQMYRYLQFVADTVAPDDAFAHYFRAYLHSKVYGHTNPAFVGHLKKILSETPEWQARFDEFGLSSNDLLTNFSGPNASELKRSA